MPSIGFDLHFWSASILNTQFGGGLFDVVCCAEESEISVLVGGCSPCSFPLQSYSAVLVSVLSFFSPGASTPV